MVTPLAGHDAVTLAIFQSVTSDGAYIEKDWFIGFDEWSRLLHGKSEVERYTW